jgi:hypothetical protein
VTVEAGTPHDRGDLWRAVEGEALWRIHADLLGRNPDQVGRCDLEKPQADHPGHRAALHDFCSEAISAGVAGGNPVGGMGLHVFVILEMASTATVFVGSDFAGAVRFA